MRLFWRLRKLVSVPRLVMLFVAVAALAAGTLSAVHVTGPSGGSGNAGILPPGSQGPQPQGLSSSGGHGLASTVVPGTETALVSRPAVVRQAVAPPARRVRELTSMRSEFSRTYLLSDGRHQAVISAGPVNYRDGSGRWEPVDTKVVRSARAGFSFQDTANVFGSFFSADPADLVRFELPSGGCLATGLPGGRRVAPRVAGSTVSYPAAPTPSATPTRSATSSWTATAGRASARSAAPSTPPPAPFQAGTTTSPAPSPAGTRT